MFHSTYKFILFMAIYGTMNGGTDTDTTRNFGEVKPSHRTKCHKKMNRMNSSRVE